MEKKIAILTGSSSGFGFLTSLELAKKGYHVLATMRNIEKGSNLIEEAKMLGIEDKIEIYELDVTSEISILQFRRYVETLDEVNLLVNNAGYAGAGFVEDIPLSEYKQQFETNVFGLIAVTQVVIPVMRMQRKGKIVNVSSISGEIGFPGLSPYVASKHAVEGFSECLRLELKPFGIDVVLVEPGSFRTNIWSSGKQVTKKSLHRDSPYYIQMKKLEDYLQKNASQYGNPNDVANLIANIAMQKEATLRYPIGQGVKFGMLVKNTLPWKLWEKIVLKKIGN